MLYCSLSHSSDDLEETVRFIYYCIIRCNTREVLIWDDTSANYVIRYSKDQTAMSLVSVIFLAKVDTVAMSATSLRFSQQDLKGCICNGKN
jgi:hypothetical protein